MVYRILCSGFWAKRIHFGLEQQEELVFALDTPDLASRGRCSNG